MGCYHLNIAAKEIVKMHEQMSSSNSVSLSVCQVLIKTLRGEGAQACLTHAMWV